MDIPPIKRLDIDKFPQDMKKCSPEGRDCIDSKSAYTFNCSVSCEGIYADVQWVENIEDEELVETELERRLGGLKSSDLSRLVYNDLKREIGMMKTDVVDFYMGNFVRGDFSLFPS